MGSSTRSRSWDRAVVVLATATGFALLESLKAFVGTRLRGLPIGWGVLLVQNIPWWYTWALLTPIVFALGRRLPLVERRTALPRALLHAVAGLLLGSLHLWITGPIFFHTNRALLTVGSVEQLVWQWHGNFLILNVVTYAMILGAFHWVEFYGRYHDGVLLAARLSAESAALQRDLAVARIETLQKELNPHFLFNTLNAVTGLIRKGETSGAIGMLVQLGDLLRATLNGDLPAEIPLADELELLRRYLAIETVRFADRLTIAVEVAPGLGAIGVPPLLLQPLVENAIRYGVAREPGPGGVRVAATAADGELTLEVRDTGPGFPLEVIEGRRFGVGLGNPAARLAQLYGPRGRIDVANDPRGGAVVTVRLPIRGVAAPP